VCQLVRVTSARSRQALIVRAPGDFAVKDLKWAPDGKGFALVDRDQFCCVFEIEEKES
jgi:hypothetical protein